MINPERARYWYGKAAERGHQMAYQVLNFAPMWEERDIDPDEADDDDVPAWMKAMLQLTDFATENGIEEAMDGEEPSLDDVVAFVSALAEKGNPEAQEVLDKFLEAVENMDQ